MFGGSVAGHDEEKHDEYYSRIGRNAVPGQSGFLSVVSTPVTSTLAQTVVSADGSHHPIG